MKPMSLLFSFLTAATCAAQEPRLRLIIETDAGGDPDDEQSMVRFLLYTNEWDVEGIIANRPVARAKENGNPIRHGLGIVRAQVKAYGQCYPNLVKHDPRYPPPGQLLACTVAGYDDTDDGVQLIMRAVDAPDPRPVWFCNWGTDHGSAVSCLKRALDRVWKERGPTGYAAFKSRLRLSSYDAFREHTTKRSPPFPFWVDTFRPEISKKRWYHRFSALTATAGGFDLERDVRTGHGPLGALYPTNTSMPQKEGDTMAFLYLVPTGMNDPTQPTWGSWAGRYGAIEEQSGKAYYWANQTDTWHGITCRDNCLARWAVALQNDFRARLDWCVADDYRKANHRPLAVLNGDRTQRILTLAAKAGETVTLTGAGSSDPDGDALALTWFLYPEAGSCRGDVRLATNDGETTSFTAPVVQKPETIHVILQVEDSGAPPLFAFRRVVVTVAP